MLLFKKHVVPDTKKQQQEEEEKYETQQTETQPTARDNERHRYRHL